jgi:SanA protein
MKIYSKSFYLVSIGILITLAVVFVLDSYIDSSTKPKIFTSVELIPENHAGLLLGTSKFLSSGNINPYFINRIKAAAELYHSDKIRRIVVSGDNSRKDYNEPQDMKEELIKLGVYENDIYLDYAGFRTYDSVIRMREIFGQDSFTVISQEFHNERAIFIASAFEINAIGFNAVDLNASMGFKTNLREKFARVKMIIDLIFKQEPKFLGEKIDIEEKEEVLRDIID